MVLTVVTKTPVLSSTRKKKKKQINLKNKNRQEFQKETEIPKRGEDPYKGFQNYIKSLNINPFPLTWFNALTNLETFGTPSVERVTTNLSRLHPQRFVRVRLSEVVET